MNGPLLIAFVSGRFSERLSLAVRELAAGSLLLICRRGEVHSSMAQSDVLKALYNIEMEIEAVDGERLFEGAVALTRRALDEYRGPKIDVMIELGGADKELALAGLAAAQLLGLRAFDVIDGRHVELPVVLMPVYSLVSQEKISILKGIEELGGSVVGLEPLSRVTGMTRALLSYHIHGSERTTGLRSMGLVEVRREGRTLQVEVTPSGRALLAASGVALTPRRRASRRSS